MAFETAVVGNLALAEQWPRFSDTESKPTPNSGCATASSTAATGSATFFIHGSSSRKAEGCVITQLDNFQLDCFSNEELQGTTLLMLDEGVLAIPNATEVFYSEPPTIGSAFLFDQRISQIHVIDNAACVASNVSRFLHGVVFGQSEPVSSFWSLYLSDACKDSEPGEKLETLRIQVRELYNEFLMWPGSYNQLLLSGSLDYCRSVIKKLRDTSPEVQDSILSQIRSYYSQCYGILQQYQEAKTTVRRLNLQSLQDKFELLQEACASAAVYPRLEDLDLNDVPNE